MSILLQTISVTLLILGFGFVIFWHELGHFLAAKAVGIKVEQFAVGMGHALISYRRGIGVRLGSTRKEYLDRIFSAMGENVPTDDQELEQLDYRKVDEAHLTTGISETEYRLNWIPLGGYVKMLGQDDMRGLSGTPDPRAFTGKSISARMFVISAGVIMNVILAGIGFMILFRTGFKGPAPVVGIVASGSPAQVAGVQVGDRISEFDGKSVYDFTKITLFAPLAKAGEPTPMTVTHPSGAVQTLSIVPRSRPDIGFVSLGISPAYELRAHAKLAELLKAENDEDKGVARLGSTYITLEPGDTITAIDGKKIAPGDISMFDETIQRCTGKSISLEITGSNGTVRAVQSIPEWEPDFAGNSLSFAGLQPRPIVVGVQGNSSAAGKVLPGDVVLGLVYRDRNETLRNLTRKALSDRLSDAGAAGREIDLIVLRDAKELQVGPVSASIKGQEGRYRVGLELGTEITSAVAAAVQEPSPAFEAGIPVGARITKMGPLPIANWFDVRTAMVAAREGKPVAIEYELDGKSVSKTITIPTVEAIRLNDLRLSFMWTGQLQPMEQVRKTASISQAFTWGVEETRDFILQAYLTLTRMFQGSIGAQNLSGPVGIFHAGANIARNRGGDWTLWFLSVISVNLAVVNFLPIPIVDGGHFVLLLLEKVMGRPLSPKAQQAVQYAGLALILGVFLFVTFHDVKRLLF